MDLAFTPDKKGLVTCGRDGQVKVWDVAKLAKAGPKDPPEAIRTMSAHKQRIIAVAMSGDGKRFVTAGADNVVKAWDTVTGEELRKWEFKQPTVPGKPFLRGVLFTPDGQQVVTANCNATLYLLDLP